jgi:hypothetical protein
MPYFQRKPLQGLVDTVLSSATIPGLPSRVRAPLWAPAEIARVVSAVPASTGIVEQAAAVLAAEQPAAGVVSDAWATPRKEASLSSSPVSQLQQQVNALIEQFAALAAHPPDLYATQVSSASAAESPMYGNRHDAAAAPAPVLSPSTPVAPGTTAQICIALVNEDDQPAPIAFLTTGLVGEDGARISPEQITFTPREVTLGPGDTGEVTVRVLVPPQTRCGIYSGLVRASQLDYLHAVLVVRVQEQ